MSVSNTTTFSYTGAQQTFIVPASVTSVTVFCKGSSGGSWGATGGGSGATISGTLAVTPGGTLYVNVGGGGTPPDPGGSVGGAGGWNGGAGGGATAGQAGYAAGAGGGGASDVRVGGTALTNRVAVAGGGGGASGANTGGGGGALSGNGLTGTGANGGPGGTQSAGGTGVGSGAPGGNGALGIGGGGRGNTIQNGTGGGGAGYYGGAGGGFSTGGTAWSAGGGGSSNASGLTSAATTATGVTGGNIQAGVVNDGYVTITYVDSAPNAPTLNLPSNHWYADVNNAIVTWTFSDPDTGDFQSAADIRYRVNAGPWTEIDGAVSGTVASYQLTGLMVGVNYEWQVRTYDALGQVGAWSTSSFFMAVLSPTPIGITSPTPGEQITNLATQGFNWIHSLRNQNGYVIQRVGDINGVADPTTVYETESIGTSSGSTAFFTNTTAHPNGPEHWQIQFSTFDGTVNSEYYDVYVVMSYAAPTVPLCVATAQPSSGAISVAEQLSDFSVDYFPLSAVPTVADTGPALTSFGSPAMNGIVSNAMLYNAATVFGQSANLGAKALSVAATFQAHDIGSTHANSVSIVAGDSGFTNCHILCNTTRSGWSISKVVSGTTTSLASGTYAALLPGTAVPLTMYASITGTTISFTDPFGTVHTATDAFLGSATGTYVKVSVDNSGTTTPDRFQLAHWSANDNANPAVFASLARSTDGVNFVPIPGANWDTQNYGSVFTYVDYTPPFNERIYYQITAYTAAGAISQSAVS